MVKVLTTCLVSTLILASANCGPGEKDTLNKWVSLKAYDQLPENALRGGYDSDKSYMYVGRGQVSGSIIAAKVIPRRGVAYAANYGKEYQLQEFDVLVGDGYYWIASFGGLVPPNAVSTGTNSQGERMYIGRTNYKDSLVIGKVHPSHKVLYFPYKGKERHASQYEILVKK